MKELWKIFCDTVKELFNDNWNKVKIAATELVKNLIGCLLNFIKVVVNILAMFVNGVFTAIYTLIDSIISLLND